MLLPNLVTIVLILALSIGIIFLCNYIKIPSIVGFLIVGIISGSKGLGLVPEAHKVEILSEIGIILLLFTIGLEVSLNRIWAMRRPVLLGGFLQVAITVLGTAVIAYGFGFPLSTAIFFGFLISLSSTAIVLKLLQEKGELDSPHGRVTLGILIFQDIAAVPMMLLIPFIAGVPHEKSDSLLLVLLKGIALLLVVIGSAKWLVPRLLYQITRTRRQELFLLSILVICFAVAWISYSIGLSLALGAFLAGLIISESHYRHQAIGNILPFRDVFISFFFISIGMLLDLHAFFRFWPLILIAALGILMVKTFFMTAISLLLKMPLRPSILSGLALCQIGKFSFILAQTGAQYRIFSYDGYQIFLAVTILTMLLTPLILIYSQPMADLILRIPLLKRLKRSPVPISPEKPERSGHLIIIGFGVNGRNLAIAASKKEIPYVVIEMNPETVKKEQVKGEPIFFGDAANEPVITHVGADRAKIAVIAINDPAATKRIIKTLRQVNPEIYIIARTPYVSEVPRVYQAGANEVVPEELETSIEIFARVLNKYEVPLAEIDDIRAEIRSDGYNMFIAENPIFKEAEK